MSYELRNRPRSPWILCGSVVEHRSAESENLKFDSSWGLKVFPFPTLVTRRKTSFFNFLSTFLPCDCVADSTVATACAVKYLILRTSLVMSLSSLLTPWIALPWSIISARMKASDLFPNNFATWFKIFALSFYFPHKKVKRTIKNTKNKKTRISYDQMSGGENLGSIPRDNCTFFVYLTLLTNIHNFKVMRQRIITYLTNFRPWIKCRPGGVYSSFYVLYSRDWVFA